SLMAATHTSVVPTPLEGQDSIHLTRQEARALALESGPRFLAAKATGEARRGVSRADQIYPFNPALEWKAVGAMDPGGTDDYEAVFSQELEWAGQWLVRRSAAGKGIEAAFQDEADAFRSLLLEVDVAFYGLSAATERARACDDGAELARSLRESVQAQLREGQVSTLEMNLASIEAARAEAQALAAQNDLALARQAFRDLLGLSPGKLVEAAEGPAEAFSIDVSDPAALVHAALSRRPDLQAARARGEEAKKKKLLASLDAIPNVDVGAVFDRAGQDQERTLGLRISLPLPLWNRNQGRREQAGAEERLRQAELREAELRVEGEVRTSMERYRLATQELELFTAGVLQPARENRGLLQQAFEAGRYDLPTTLLLQTQLIGAELAYWDAWERHRTAAAELEAALGGGR
ncbi:MAG: TolC family protein, partial [Longimicrobiales bacterium]|nr:TolC family protein [Longimicrobiales bacterium]